MSGLFYKIKKCFLFINEEFKNHALSNIINYFIDLDVTDFKIKISNCLFDILYVDWISKGKKLNSKLKGDKKVKIKVIVTKFTIKALKKYNSWVYENSLQNIVPVIVIDSSNKDYILKTYADLCISNMDITKIDTEKDVVIEFKKFFNKCVNDSVFDGGYTMLSSLKHNEGTSKIISFFESLKDENTTETIIQNISNFLKKDKIYTKNDSKRKNNRNNKDTNDKDKNDPKRPRK